MQTSKITAAILGTHLWPSSVYIARLFCGASQAKHHSQIRSIVKALPKHDVYKNPRNVK